MVMTVFSDIYIYVTVFSDVCVYIYIYVAVFSDIYIYVVAHLAARRVQAHVHYTCSRLNEFSMVLQSLSANQCGEMRLSVETDMVAINTHFKDLFNPSWREFISL